MKKIEPLPLDGLTTYSLSGRHSKVSAENFGRAWEKGGSLKEFGARLPKILGGSACREVTAAWVKARKNGRFNQRILLESLQSVSETEEK